METQTPLACGQIVDLAAINGESKSIWVMLAEDGNLYRFDAEGGRCELLARNPSQLNSSPGGKVRSRLHTSSNGQFAAVVEDYGQYARVYDLASGKVTLELDGGSYHAEQVPFSMAFSTWRGRVIAIHRADWNRLEVSDAASGTLLTSRSKTSHEEGEVGFEHYLDYFHGALYLSPDGFHILDDGWIWHPMGVPSVWNLDRWLTDDVWESESGQTRIEICSRDYYWDHGCTWLNNRTLALSGIGDGQSRDDKVKDGARIFELGALSKECREIRAFAGPSGKFFSDGRRLFSSAPTGLTIWDPDIGSKLSEIEHFVPSHQHLGAGELAQVIGTTLVRWKTDDIE